MDRIRGYQRWEVEPRCGGVATARVREVRLGFDPQAVPRAPPKLSLRHRDAGTDAAGAYEVVPRLDVRILSMWAKAS